MEFFKFLLYSNKSPRLFSHGSTMFSYRRYARKNNLRFKKFTFEAGQGVRDFPRRDDPEIVPLDTFTFFLEKKKKKKKKQWLSFKIIII